MNEILDKLNELQSKYDALAARHSFNSQQLLSGLDYVCYHQGLSEAYSDAYTDLTDLICEIQEKQL